MKNNTPSRREFLRASAAAAAAATAVPHSVRRAAAAGTVVRSKNDFPNGGRADCYNTADRFFSRMVYPSGVELLYFVALGDRRKYGTVDEHATTTDEQVAWLFGEGTPGEIASYKRNGVLFIGEEGRIFVNRGGVHGKAVEQLAEDPLPADAWRARPSDNHMGNFFACAASRDEPVSPVRIQHRTITACHLTNISLRLQRPLEWDPAAEQIVGDREAQGWLRRDQRPPYQIEM